MPGNVEKRLNLDSQDLYPIGLVKKSSFGFLPNVVWKSPNELFGQPNMWDSTSDKVV